MALLSSKPCYGSLEVGKHIVTIAEFRDVENEKGGNVQVLFKKENGQEELNTYFPGQIKGLIGKLRGALGIPVDVALTYFEVLHSAKENQSKIEIEISYNQGINSNTGNLKNYRNVNITPSPVETTETVEVTETVKTTKANAKKTAKAEATDATVVVNKELGF